MLDESNLSWYIFRDHTQPNKFCRQVATLPPTTRLHAGLSLEMHSQVSNGKTPLLVSENTQNEGAQSTARRRTLLTIYKFFLRITYLPLPSKVY